MSDSSRGAWSTEMNALTRAVSGAYIFGIPLLFTMEMWWIGEYAERWKLLAFLVLAFGANLGLSWVSGFRRETTLRGIVEEATEAVAVGIVAAIIMLLVLNRIAWGAPIAGMAGMIIVQAVPLSIGASVANEVFGRPGDRLGDENHAQRLPRWQELFTDVGATAIGSVFIGFSIAPTEEIAMIAAGLGTVHLVAIVGFTMLVSYAIVFASGFDTRLPEGPFQHPLTETVLAYTVSLLVAAAALYLFDQVQPSQPIESILTQTIVLGVPAAVGGAAGRLVV